VVTTKHTKYTKGGGGERVAEGPTEHTEDTEKNREWERFSFRVFRVFRGLLLGGWRGRLVADQGGDAGAEFEFDFELHG